MKKVFSFILVTVLSLSTVFALDLSLRLTPDLLFPTEKIVKEKMVDGNTVKEEISTYDMGFGGVFQADANLFNIMSVGLEGGFDYLRPKMLQPISVFYGGVGVGAYYYPISRLYLGAGGAFGGYFAKWMQVSEKNSSENKEYRYSDLYWRAYGEAGFRVNPSLTVSLNGGYSYFMAHNSSKSYLNKGPFAGISVKINMDVGKKGSGNVSATVEQYDDVFPVYMQLYRNSPLGVIHLTNFESAEIRDVTVSFRAGKYTASAKECAKINLLQKFKSVEIPLMSDFSNEILNFSENGMISGEVVIEYEFLGKKKVSVENVVLNVNNRNAFVWSDAAALGAFVSPDTPEVLEFAKYCAGVARNNLYTGMNRNIQFAASIFEGLRAGGITYSGDALTPYVTYHTGFELDSVQYPLQTMNCLSGDYDDLGILFAACCESVGIPTALIPYDDDFLVLVALDVKPNQAGNHFSDAASVLTDDKDVYFALSMKEFEKGFTVSRKTGAKILKECLADTTGKYEYINIHDAWTLYPPVVYSNGTSTFETPNQVILEKETKAAISDYIATELETVISTARQSGNDNKLGVALVRAGKYTEAKEAFNRAAKTGSLSAMNNIANVLMYEKNYSAAAAQYSKVLDKDPKNKIAIKGLENAKGKLED